MNERAASNETLLEGQKRALELAVRGAPLAEILDALVRTVEAQSSSDVIGSVLVVDELGTRLLHGAAPTLPQAYNDAIHGIAIGDGVGSCGTAAATGAIVVVDDIATDALWANFKTLALEHGLRACWSMPIKSPRGEVLGTFALYHRTPKVPTARDIEVVELLAGTAALVIGRDRDLRATAALAAAMTEQSLDVQRAVSELRTENARLAARVAELEKAR